MIKGLVDILDCSSIGVKLNFADYISQPKEVNTFAGVTSFILGTFKHGEITNHPFLLPKQSVSDKKAFNLHSHNPNPSTKNKQ